LGDGNSSFVNIPEIVSHFAGKFELAKKAASGIIDEVAILAVSETKKIASLTLPGIGKLVLAKRLINRKNLDPSAFGKMIIIASTEGNVVIPGTKKLGPG
jgi:nucleoid DNA-binding protein